MEVCQISKNIVALEEKLNFLNQLKDEFKDETQPFLNSCNNQKRNNQELKSVQKNLSEQFDCFETGFNKLDTIFKEFIEDLKKVKQNLNEKEEKSDKLPELLYEASFNSFESKIVDKAFEIL